ncbi:MAG: hypothetical protein M0027_18420 [Candidatus Dormibacteraeota bacterium]|nr:hypothetical protein [Candidatus Dormibacteraeota bacterium]
MADHIRSPLPPSPDPAPAVPTVTQLTSSRVAAALGGRGSQTLGHETNLARAPLWDVRPRPVQLELIAPSVLYGRQFRQVAGQPLTVADQRLFAELTTQYLREGCPADRRVKFSLGSAARLIGHESIGGETRRLVRGSLGRLRSVTVESALRAPDGHEEALLWGLLDRAFVTTRGGGQGWVTLSEEIAQLLQAGSVTFLHAPTWDAITAADSVAGRLWTFLEAESLREPRRYSLFAGPPKGLTEERNLPAVAELLRLEHWSERWRVAQRVRQACLVLTRHDLRYQADLVKGRAVGMWRLEVARSPRVTMPATGLPQAVLTAWRRTYQGRLPSPRQTKVLQEVLARRPSEWVATQLSTGGGDPLRRLLAADTALSRSRLESAAVAEAAWAEEKAAEATTLEPIGAILRRLAHPE